MLQYGGAALMTGNGIIAGSAAAIAVIVWARGRAEDRLMADQFGQRWRDWADRTGMLLPRCRRGGYDTCEPEVSNREQEQP
jgi:protein-S-isoprenylcysteine O-methyltransferase Ste14